MFVTFAMSFKYLNERTYCFNVQISSIHSCFMVKHICEKGVKSHETCAPALPHTRPAHTPAPSSVGEGGAWRARGVP